MELDTAQASLAGNRADNQDRAEILIGDEATFAILADGMGGHANGALAAETAIATLSKAFRRARSKNPDIEKFFRDALTKAHKKVLALGDGMALNVKPGTIIVCALIWGDTMWWAHVGDSRAYHFRGKKLLARTRDHSEVETLVATGKISPAEAINHQSRHIVEHCLGVAPDTPPIAISDPIPFEMGDTVLLCSDGLWDQLDESTLIEQMSSTGDLHKLLDHLVQLSTETGSPHSDNVTAIAIRPFDDHED